MSEKMTLLEALETDSYSDTHTYKRIGNDSVLVVLLLLLKGYSSSISKYITTVTITTFDYNLTFTCLEEITLFIKYTKVFPFHLILSTDYNNKQLQLSFIQHYLTQPLSNTNNLTTITTNEQVTLTNTYELYELLVTLDSLTIIDTISKTYPECLLLGLLHTNTQIQIITEIIHKLLLVFIITPNTCTPTTLHHIYTLHTHLFIQILVELYTKESTFLSRILDITQDILLTLLPLLPFNFAIDLAVLASRREYLNLEKWLQSMAVSIPFITSLCHYISNSNTNQHTHIYIHILSQHSTIPLVSDTLTSLSFTFSSDVEQEANSYYEQLYKSTLSVASLLTLLQRFQSSTTTRDVQIYNCMIHSLFDEYRFFPKFPEKELALTSLVFGGLVQHSLVSYSSLSIALRCILDAIRKGDDKMCWFGVNALSQFKDRLVEWPQYCVYLLQCTVLREKYPDMYSVVASVVAANKCAKTASFNTLSIDTLLNNTIKYPSEELQDSISFIFNNLSSSNLVEKSTEFMQLSLIECYVEWIAYYIVVKRVSIEPNFHLLYIDFIDSLTLSGLDSFILQSTISNLLTLLSSPKAVTLSSERTLIKNLSTWLGLITLARNKPILDIHIAIRHILLQGYRDHRLIVVIPFACKVLESAAKSFIFRPPNPWTMSILRFLAELYCLQLKLNLKFEIELVCKCLNVDLKDVEPTSLLASLDVHVVDVPTMVGHPFHGATLQSFGSFLVCSACLPNAHSLLESSIQKALRECSCTLVERTVAVACVTCRELVSRDFCMETSLERIKSGAHAMALALSASLACVTSRESLRQGILLNLKELYVQHGLVESDETLGVVVDDNMGLALYLVERIAMERAGVELEQAMESVYSKRRGGERGELSVDQQVFESIVEFQDVPDVLVVRAPSLLSSQWAVYHDYEKLAFSDCDSAGAFGGPTLLPVDKYSHLLVELEKMIHSSQLLLFQQNGQLESLLRDILATLVTLSTLDETALATCQKLMQQLYKNDYAVAREIYVTLLFNICAASKVAHKEVTNWLLYSTDERKYNVPVTAALLKIGLISVEELDSQLARAMEGGGMVNQFVVKLIHCVIEEGFVGQTDLKECVGVVERMVELGVGPDEFLVLLKALSGDDKADAVSIKLVGYFKAFVVQAKCGNGNLSELEQKGVLTEDVNPLFFRCALDYCVDLYRKTRQKAFSYIDGFAHLLVLCAQHKNESIPTKIAFFAKTLSIVVLVLVHEHETCKFYFNQKPFFRLFHTLLIQVQQVSFSSQLLTSIGNTLHTIKPTFVPGFAFAWMALMSHRHFMPKLLLSEGQKGWPLFLRLVVDLFKFVGPFAVKSKKPVSKLLYRGTLRILLVLLHDFPEFLSCYYFSLCDALPMECIQFRNLILSAYPRTMRLPDPLMPELKVDMLPEISQPPRLLSDYSALMNGELVGKIDGYLKVRGPVSVLVEVRNELFENALGNGEYDAGMIHAVVLHLGIASTHKSNIPITNSPALDILTHLLEGDSQSKYLIITAIANNLRFPNSHTHYFSCLILYLFASSTPAIQEIIARVLVERLVGNRPHPWGLLITFIELIKNARYDFWGKGFLRGEEEVERLFESVAASINVS